MTKRAGKNGHLETVTVKITDLIPADYNPRVMPPDEMDSLVRSLSRWGFVEPVVVNRRNGHIVGGHQRVAAAKLLGMTHVPVVYRELLDEDERLLNLALNRIHGEWDTEKLDSLIASLHASGAALDVTGFSPGEITASLDAMLPEAEQEFSGGEEFGKIKTPDSKPGEIYELGRHRLLCGDSSDAAAVKRLMEGEVADMIFTDPPYNVNYKSRGKLGGIKNDSMEAEKFRGFCRGFAYTMRSALKPGGVYYVCSGWSSWGTFFDVFRGGGLPVSGCIVWDKGSPSMGWSDYRFQHEQIFVGFADEDVDGHDSFEWIAYGHDDRARRYFKRTRSATDVWRVPRKARQHYLHPTEKPVGLVENALRNSTLAGQSVLDIFAGSGVVMEACQRLGRVAYMVELDPKWCDVIRKRWEFLSGTTMGAPVGREARRPRTLEKAPAAPWGE